MRDVPGMMVMMIMMMTVALVGSGKRKMITQTALEHSELKCVCVCVCVCSPVWYKHQLCVGVRESVQCVVYVSGMCVVWCGCVMCTVLWMCWRGCRLSPLTHLCGLPKTPKLLTFEFFLLPPLFSYVRNARFTQDNSLDPSLP